MQMQIFIRTGQKGYMMFNPISAAENIKNEFIGYISTLFHISDKEYAAQFISALQEEGAISKGPYLDVSDSYETGKCLEQMIEEGLDDLNLDI